jgi:hypothetical protein
MIKKYSLHKIDEEQSQLEIDGTLECGMIYNDKYIGEWTVDMLNQQDTRITELNQHLQDYEDNVHNFFIEHWNELSDDMKQQAHLELGVNIDYDE